jgi:hypothetical protein
MGYELSSSFPPPGVIFARTEMGSGLERSSIVVARKGVLKAIFDQK